MEGRRSFCDKPYGKGNKDSERMYQNSVFNDSKLEFLLLSLKEIAKLHTIPALYYQQEKGAK